MNSISRAVLLSAMLMAAPLAGAIAQTNPTGNYGSNRSATASPGTADSQAASGISTGDVGSKKTAGTYSGTGSNATTPGATGRTVVPGTNSSQADASSGTARAQSGGGSGGK